DDEIDEAGRKHRVVVAVASEPMQQAPPGELAERLALRVAEHVGMRRGEHGVAELRARARLEPVAPLGLDEPSAAGSAEKDLPEHGLTEQPEQRHAAVR